MEWERIEREIEAYREELKRSERVLEVLDFGAGSPEAKRSEEEMSAGVRVNVPLKDMARIGIKGAAARRLSEIIKAQESRVILELGTCCGFSSAYMSKAAPEANIHTIEGAPEIAKIALETRAKLGVENVVQHVGRFVDVLPDLLPKIAPLDFVFIDGHHDKEATIGYFRQILPFMREGGVMVFDDITWSEGMKEAWHTILASGAHKRSEDDNKVGILWL